MSTVRDMTYEPALVSLVIAGQMPSDALSRAGRQEAIRRLRAKGLPARVVADRLHVTPRTVQRHSRAVANWRDLYGHAMGKRT